MQELDLTWGRIYQFWWAIIWRSVAIILPLAFVVAMTANSVVTNIAASPSFTFIEEALLLPLYPIILRMALRAQYRGFRIVLVDSNSERPGSE